MHTSRLLPHVLGVLLPFTLLVAEDRRLECEVLKADGSSAVNASVFCYRPPSVNGILAQPVFAVGKTDEKGRFSATISQAEPVKVLYGMALALSADGEAGWMPFSGNAPNQEPTITTKITVMLGGDFRARLLQPDGQPAAGVEVWVHGCAMPRKPEDRFPNYIEMGRLPGPHWKATTDADGRCVIRQVPQGASIYLAHADASFAQLHGMHEILMPKMPKADGAEYELRLVNPGSIRGRVMLPDGMPAAHSIAHIIEHTPYVTAYSTEVLTDAQGGFVITQIPPSKYRLRFATQPPFDEEWIGAEKDGVEVKAGGVTDVGDLKVSKVSIVTAEVVNAETGAKIEEPVIIRLAAGSHELHYRSHRMTPEGYHPPGRDDDLSVNVADGERKTVQFKLKPVKPQDMIAGLVLNAEGKPAEGTTVLMMGGGYDSAAPTKTKADGRFQFSAPLDARQITLLAWDGEKAMSDPVDAKRGESVTVKMRSGGFASVSGRIVDEQGKPIRDAKVTWNIMGIEYGFHPGPVSRDALTDADGRFSFPRLWAGTDHLIFFCSAEGYGGAALRDEKLIPGEKLDLKITFKKADQSISGVLLQADGSPSTHASISAQGDGQPSRNQATTDAEGRFTIKGLSVGNVSLRIYDPATRKSFYHRAKVPAENIRASWPSAEGTVTGVVVDSAGKPMPDAAIEVFEYGVKAAADKQGRFALTGLRKGWFTAEVKATTADGTKIEKRQRLKPGMSNVRVQMPPKTLEYEPQPAIPLDLIGKPAADLQIATWINSEPLSAKAGGKVLILDFFGMQCAPCLAGFPKVQAFWETHRGKNIEVIAHGSDFYPVQEVRDYLTKNPKLKFPIAIAGPTSSYARDYDIRGIPFYVVIDQAGKIVSIGHDWDAAAAAALKLIGE